MDFFNGIFMDYMPHGQCWNWDPFLISLLLISNIIIAIAYFSIPRLLYTIYRKREMDRQLSSFLVLFAWFILLCGAGHLIKVYNIWGNNFYFEAIWDMITGFFSILTAVGLYKALPRIIATPTPEQMVKAEAEIGWLKELLEKKGIDVEDREDIEE